MKLFKNSEKRGQKMGRVQVGVDEGGWGVFRVWPTILKVIL